MRASQALGIQILDRCPPQSKQSVDGYGVAHPKQNEEVTLMHFMFP